MGFFDWFFQGNEIEPRHQPMVNPWANPVLMDFLFSGFVQDPTTGHWGMNPLPAYPGQTSPNLQETILPQVWSQWNSQGGAGQNYLLNFLQQGGHQLTPEFIEARNNQLARGGAGGAPTTAMEQAMYYGAPEGEGLNAIKNMLQYGAAGPAGQFLSNMAQFGMPSEAGRPLHNRAMGIPTAATNHLLLYTGGKK